MAIHMVEASATLCRPRHANRRLTARPRRAQLALAVALVGVLLASQALTACSGCGEEPLRPKSAEEAAELWGKLLCDRRDSMASLQITDLKNKRDVLVMRAHLLAKGMGADDAVSALAEHITFIEEHGRKLLQCEVEVLDKTPRDNGTKVFVEIGVTFARLEGTNTKPPAPRMRENTLRTGVEVTLIDGAWRVTAEPAGADFEPELWLFPPSTQAQPSAED